MKRLLIEPHFNGSIEYFSLLRNYEEVMFEVSDHFQKQTYRNRMQILGSNKVLTLTVPVNFSSRTTTRDVTIDYSERWVKDHWGAIYSSYGKAPFFEFFEEEFRKIWNRDHRFLIDLNGAMLSACLKILGIRPELNQTESYQKEALSGCEDFRNFIRPKIDFSDRNIYNPKAYSQLFGNSFVPNLSIIDLIMCEGPRASEVLAESFRGDHRI